LGHPEEEARNIAAKYRGFGPGIYGMNEEEWKTLLCDGAAATDVYALILGVSNEQGAKPRGFKFIER